MNIFPILKNFRAYGGSQSLAHRNRSRMLQYFETKEDAQQRTENEKEKIKKGIKRKHNHIGKEDAYTWKAGECLKEVSEYADGQTINYSQLAKKYEMKNKDNEYPPNGGQIVKEYLVNNEIDISKFEAIIKRSTTGIRRAIRR